MRKWIIILMAMLLAAPVVMSSPVGDDDDKDPSIKPGIRRLHPERERAKAIKQLQDEMSRKAEPKDDPWDMTGEVWGTVDLPREAKDVKAVEGRRLTQRTSKTPAEQQMVNQLINTDYSIHEYSVGDRRMLWRDEPVTSSVDELLPFFSYENGEYLSKYVSRDKTSNEIYFIFSYHDSVPGPLRLCIQYCADDPLDYDMLTVNVDGFDYVYYPSNIERGRQGKKLYWELCDNVLNPAYKDMVYALAHSHWAFIKFHGANGINHVKTLSQGQRDDFAHALDLYRLLGGGWSAPAVE
ncbi:MAG: hypothetical protein IKZ92_10065 [Muribaculaceae bacterium]|nr:hypothetical protein [Muribaculaceae bacterium]